MLVPREFPMLTTFVAIAVQSIILSCLVSRLVVSPLMSISNAQLSLFKRAKQLPLVTVWLWTAFFGSWCFVVAVDVLQHGSVLTDSGPCTASIFVCISLYCVSKAALYLFLTERAHIVRGGTRKSDKLYWFNLSLIVGILALWVLCHIYRVAKRTDDRCIISIGRAVDIPFIIYDFFINIFLTAQFLVPVIQSSSLQQKFNQCFRRSSPKNDQSNFSASHSNEVERELYSLARRTAIGGIFCTLVTIANGIQVALMFGKEDAWLCLTTCSGDVVLNCIILHFVTNGRQGTDESVKQAALSYSSTAPELHMELRSHTPDKSKGVEIQVKERFTGSGSGSSISIEEFP